MKIRGTFKLNIVGRPAGDAQPAWDARLGGYFRTLGAKLREMPKKRDATGHVSILSFIMSILLCPRPPCPLLR